MSAPSCPHAHLRVTPSTHAADVDFETPGPLQRAAAVTSHGRVKDAAAQGVKAAEASMFPAPIVLPDDCLYIDPKYPPQSLREFKKLEFRSEQSPERQTMYFAVAPDVAHDVSFVRSWAQIQSAVPTPAWKSAPTSMFDNVHKYLQAFYQGMEVKRLDNHLRFVNVQRKAHTSKRKIHARSKTKPDPQPDQIGLEFSIEQDRYVMDIRARVSPHEETPIYPRQLNLNDLLDAAIAMLPADAYALLLLVDHDIYEDDDDDFACGRAYGGSRVAVVSASRYNPALDEAVPGLDREHAWPASHCAEYLENAYEEISPVPRKKKRPKTNRSTKIASGVSHNSQRDTISAQRPSPLASAIESYKHAGSKLQAEDRMSLEAQAWLWVSRICKTASHELAHCVGMDHCIYYACIMQGTASLAEDARQPPYLCPVDLAKLLDATGGNQQMRYEALLSLCMHDGWRDEPMFAAYAAWIRNCLEIECVEMTERETIVID